MLARSAAADTIYDPWHYVPVLARKPGGLAQTALPSRTGCFRLRSNVYGGKLASADDGNRQMVDILNAVSEPTACRPSKQPAPRRSLTAVHSADVVLNILARQRDPAPPAQHPHPGLRLTLRHAPIAELCPLRQPQENHLMERTQLFDLMGELKLYGMKAAFDEIMATAVKRQHEPQRIVGDLLNAEINEKQARSIKYQLTIAKLPLAKGS